MDNDQGSVSGTRSAWQTGSPQDASCRLRCHSPSHSPPADAGFCPEDQHCNVSTRSGPAPLDMDSPGQCEQQATPGGAPDLFQCTQCNKTLSTQKILRKHIRTVHSNIRYHCTFFLCQASFASHNGLTKHMATAHDDSVFLCPDAQCAQKFVTMAKLQEHCNKFHPGNRIKKCNCSITDKFLPQYCIQSHNHKKEWLCIPLPKKKNYSKSRKTKQVEFRERAAKKRKDREEETVRVKVLRAEALDSIMHVYIPHEDLRVRVQNMMKRLGLPVMVQVKIPWYPLQKPKKVHGILQLKPAPASSPPPAPDTSSLDMPILVLDDPNKIQLDLEEQPLDFEL